MPKITVIKKVHTLVIFSILSLTVTGSLFWFMSPPVVTQGDTETVNAPSLQSQGKRIVVRLTDMTITLQNGTTTVGIYPIVSQGKPGSYYETIGGAYTNDYKTPLHFSSIGHVYMPYSVHVFGNYFIHGIPYYPDGTPVSSAFSGGCIRLTNDIAKIIYDFTDEGTPIIVTRDSELNFNPTEVSTSTLISSQMTNLMVASISLEALTQDDVIIGIEGEITTRRKILPHLVINGNTIVATLYAKSMGEENFLSLMNQKAKALGLTNTHFIDVTSPVLTTYEDQQRFMRYITTYKKYLLQEGSMAK